MRRRLTGNKNLHLFDCQFYESFPLMLGKGPFIEEYLERTLCTIQGALNIYPRLLAILVNLNYPIGYVGHDNKAISRFFDSLKEKVEHDRTCAQRDLNRAHDSKVYYVWVKEYGHHGLPHYHCLILLNRDAYFKLGSYTSTNDNLYNRITSAWISALNDARAKPYFLENGVFRINLRDGDMAIAELFRRCSYFCKVETKQFDGKGRAFGCSQFT